MSTLNLYHPSFDLTHYRDMVLEKGTHLLSIRCKLPVVIGFTNGAGSRPIHGHVQNADGTITVRSWYADGSYVQGKHHAFDLFIEPKPPQAYLWGAMVADPQGTPWLATASTLDELQRNHEDSVWLSEPHCFTAITH